MQNLDNTLHQAFYSYNGARRRRKSLLATNISLRRRSPAIVSNPVMLRIFAFLMLANSCKHGCVRRRCKLLQSNEHRFSPQIKKRFAHQRSECACTLSGACNEEFGNTVACDYRRKNLNRQKHETLLNSRVSGVGGEEEIRTLEPLLTVTRFPVARPRPN